MSFKTVDLSISLIFRCTLRFPSTTIRIQFENLADLNNRKQDGPGGKSTSVINTNIMYRPLKISISEQEGVLKNIKISFPSPTGTISAANSCPTSPRHNNYHDFYPASTQQRQQQSWLQWYGKSQSCYTTGLYLTSATVYRNLQPRRRLALAQSWKNLRDFFECSKSQAAHQDGARSWGKRLEISRIADFEMRYWCLLQREYECQTCKKPFKKKNHLTRHEKQVHMVSAQTDTKINKIRLKKSILGKEWKPRRDSHVQARHSQQTTDSAPLPDRFRRALRGRDRWKQHYQRSDWNEVIGTDRNIDDGFIRQQWRTTIFHKPAIKKVFDTLTCNLLIFQHPNTKNIFGSMSVPELQSSWPLRSSSWLETPLRFVVYALKRQGRTLYGFGG
jgi:hypothetical protein